MSEPGKIQPAFDLKAMPLKWSVLKRLTRSPSRSPTVKQLPLKCMLAHYLWLLASLEQWRERVAANDCKGAGHHRTWIRRSRNWRNFTSTSNNASEESFLIVHLMAIRWLLYSFQYLLLFNLLAQPLWPTTCLQMPTCLHFSLCHLFSVMLVCTHLTKKFHLALTFGLPMNCSAACPYSLTAWTVYSAKP